MPKRAFQPTPYIKWYPGDALRKTMHLTNDEFGTYCLWINIIYGDGHFLPTDECKLQMLGRVPAEDWPRIKQVVLERYFELTPDGWMDNKCIEVMADVTQTIEASSKRGRDAANARWNREQDNDPYGIAEANDALSNAQAVPEQSQSKSESESKSEVKPKTRPTSKASNILPAQDEGGKAGKDSPGVNSVMTRCRMILGKKEMQDNGGLWRIRARENVAKLNRVLDDIEACLKDGKTYDNIGAHATDLWKQFG